MRYTAIFPLLFMILSVASCGKKNEPSPDEKSETVVSEKPSSEADELNTLINTYAEYGDFNGAVLVAKKGEVVYEKGFGWANMEHNVANKTDTKFRLGSITKQFTAMLIMQLVAENKLDLNEPISTYLPDYPKSNGDIITIHHLLTHSSGIPNSYDPPLPIKDIPDMHIPDNYLPKDIVAAFSRLPLEFEPGETFSYSNSGYMVLGHIIETVTQQTVEEVLQEKICGPLGMKNTGIERYRNISPNRANGYFKSWGEYYNANYIDMSNVFTAGAIYATVEDLFLWDQALYSDQLLPKKYRDMMFTAHIPDPGYRADYGYGWSIKEKSIGNTKDKVHSVSHDGVIDGFCAIITRLPASKTSIILLSNVRHAPLNAMTKGIMGILFDKSYSFPKRSAAYAMLDVIDKNGIDKGVEYYETIKDDDDFYLIEEDINIVSYRLLQSDRGEAAAEVLKLGIEAFPKAFNLYDSYGEVLRTLGQTEASIEHYKKSIQLNPKNENGIKMLEEMGVDLK